MMPLRFLLLAPMFMSQAIAAIPLSLGLLPFSLAGSWIGARLGNRIPADTLRHTADALLAFSGIHAASGPPSADFPVGMIRLHSQT
jgi:uncharacterized membrane protein YfcA